MPKACAISMVFIHKHLTAPMIVCHVFQGRYKAVIVEKERYLPRLLGPKPVATLLQAIADSFIVCQTLKLQGAFDDFLRVSPIRGGLATFVAS